MLEVKCQERLDAVRAFADSVGARDKFEARLNYLATYGERSGKEVRCTLYSDFAPNSFEFLIEAKGEDGKFERWFNGGLIYSGPSQPLDGSAPALSVSLNQPEGHDWSVHT